MTNGTMPYCSPKVRVNCLCCAEAIPGGVADAAAGWSACCGIISISLPSQPLSPINATHVETETAALGHDQQICRHGSPQEQDEYGGMQREMYQSHAEGRSVACICKCSNPVKSLDQQRRAAKHLGWDPDGKDVAIWINVHAAVCILSQERRASWGSAGCHGTEVDVQSFLYPDLNASGKGCRQHRDA